MRIGIDISQISYQGTGVSRFTEGLINVILKEDNINTWIFFYSSLRNSLDPVLKEKIISSRHIVVQYKIPSTILAFLWNSLHILPIELFTGKLDLFISSDWTEPPSNCKKTTIIHDLAFTRYPETIHSKILANQKKRLYWVTKESDFIITDSLSTKNDLMHYFNFDENRIIVIYPGVNQTVLANIFTKKTLTKFHLKEPFIFTVGKIEPRKNLKRLIAAYLQLKADDSIPDLVIAGQKGWEDESDFLPKKNKKIHFLGYISDTELADLYRSCLFFIYPSLWEGFGYPIIEAMIHKAPVATSNSSSMAEIAHNSALLFDPLDIDSIAHAIKELIENKNLRLDLQKKGTIRAEDFTWSTYYQKLIHIINKNIL